MSRYAILQCGSLDAARYRTREEATAEAERLNAEMLEECGEDLGDGAATVVALDECPGHPGHPVTCRRRCCR